MSNTELIESVIPDFVDVTVTSNDTEEEHIEEIVVVEAESDGEIYRAEMAFEDTQKSLSELKVREAQALIRRVVETATENSV